MNCVSACRKELSTDQVEQPINIAALSKWVGEIPEDVVRDMDRIAPMLRKLGYDPFGNPPKYGEPDKEVLEKSKNVKVGPAVREDRRKEVEDRERKENMGRNKERKMDAKNRKDWEEKRRPPPPNWNEGMMDMRRRRGGGRM